MRKNSIAYKALYCLLLLLISLAMPLLAQDKLLHAGHFEPAPNERLYHYSERDIQVTAGVPSAKETKSIFGYDLYKTNVQPVWLKIENTGDKTLILAPMGVDSRYYTARETRYRSAGKSLQIERLVSGEFSQSSLSSLTVLPHSQQSGYVFSRVDEGTKSFNVDVIGDESPYRMSFFVPVPGLRLDHYTVDIKKLYPENEIRSINQAELIDELEAMPCCVNNKSGEDNGDPINLVLIGEVEDIYYAFMRAGWDETETIYGASLFKTFKSAVFGGKYRYSPVSALYVFGRAQDVALQRARDSIHERNHLRLWITPLRIDGKPVWIGQVSRDIGIRFTWRTITTHKIDPNVDETREFLVEDLAYSQSLEKIAYVNGVGSAPYDHPRGNLTGDPYFTDGKRVVMWISKKANSIDDIDMINLRAMPNR